MMDNCIITDLDDTLLSTHFRQYSCINDYILHSGQSFIDFETYYELRRSNHFSNTQLLESLKIKLDWQHFKIWYLANIESEKYLVLDTLIVDKQLFANTVQNEFKLVLLSLRNNHQQALQQLHNLGIEMFFSEICFVQHNQHANPKINILKQMQASYNVVAFCGDSISDYEAAKLLNINFVQVKTSLYLLPDFEHAVQFKNINQYFLSIP